MFQIAYEYPEQWPESGPLKIKAQLQGEIQIAPIEARREANQYVTLYMGILLGVDDPVLLWGNSPKWQFTCYLHMPQLGRVAPVGTIDVDASTGKVIPLSDKDIQAMQDQARDLAQRLSS